MIRVLRDRIREEIIFVIVLIIALVASIFRPINIAAIDWKVIAVLLNLMLLALAFEKYGVLDKIATEVIRQAKTRRGIGYVLTILTATLGMLVTNDVALITIVPITLNIGRKTAVTPTVWIVLETMAANIGSSLTPFGNPQNLFLYSKFGIANSVFFKVTGSFVLIGLLLLMSLNRVLLDKEILRIDLKPAAITAHKRAIWMFLLFILMLLSILRWLNIWMVTAVVIGSFLLLERKLFRKVDYYLLGTFLCFFIAIDHLSHWSLLQIWVQKIAMGNISVFLLSVALSQVISNVPTAIFMSGFTKCYEAILLGVSVGGLGTMIASMANLISYKLYIKEHSAKNYRSLFYGCNAVGLIFFTSLFILLMV